MSRPFLTPREVAQLIHHSRNTVMELIHSGELEARDERCPGSNRPRYRIERAAVDRWLASRTIMPAARPEPKPRAGSVSVAPVLPAFKGILDRRIARLQAKRNGQ